MKKRKLHIIIGASAVSVLTLAALAQDTPISKKDRPDYTRDRAPHERRTDRLNGAARASDVIGMAVKNYQDEKLGKVDDLAVDMESGRIVQVILSTGGFVGIGDTLSAVPPGALHHDVAHKVLHLDADKEKLKAAPKFEMSKWGEYSDPTHLGHVYRYYGEEPNFTFIENGNNPRDGHNSANVHRNTEGQPKRNSNSSPNTVATRNPDGTWAKDRTGNEDQFMIPAARLANVQKASKLIGTSVKNAQDEKLGKVENLLLDLASGRVVAAIVSSGGFLGMGDELSAVPPSALRFTSDRDALELNASKETLARAPHFKSTQWPDFNEAGYTHGVYRAYKIEPYFTTDATDATARNVRDRDDARRVVNGDVDNTERYVRDRDDRTFTPLIKQGASKADVDTTSRIRDVLIAAKDLSVNAKTVTVITLDGRVTLRGTVNSVEEKRHINEIAARIASPANVDNELEVDTSSDSSIPRAR